MQTLLWVGMGGFFGAVFRYTVFLLVELIPVPVLSSGVGGVLLVNSLGSFMAGFLLERIQDNDLRLLLITGFLGAFTTFSAFSREGMKLYYDKSWFLLSLFVFFNVIGSLLCFQWGYQWGK